MTKRERNRKVSKEKERLTGYIFTLPTHFSVRHEFSFHPKRKWRFDWGIAGISPTSGEWLKVAIEYEGAVFTNGGHVRGVGYTANCEKYNTAALMGWTVLRFTAPMIRAGMHETMIAKALE